MRIGWLIPNLGTYGSVREVIETSNVLIDPTYGHAVTIFTPAGESCEWLPCKAKYAASTEALTRQLDALIIVGLTGTNWDIFRDADVPLKVVCIMGFDPQRAPETGIYDTAPGADHPERFAAALSGQYPVIADAPWQCAWFKEHIPYLAVGPTIGGVNVRMFRPVVNPIERDWPTVVWSGDMRKRKGSAVVLEAIRLVQAAGIELHVDNYWGKSIPQDRMAHFLAGAHVFVDGHTRGGWCNPVVEAMACRVATVCTATPCTSDFARHNLTAMVVPPDDPPAMAEAIKALLLDKCHRQYIAANGYSIVQQYSYDTMAPRMGAWLRTMLTEAKA